MNVDTSSERPLFQQIADEIEDAIFIKTFIEEEQIPSTTELSVLWKINPHTILKGMNMLVDEGSIYKKRGIGMFVSTGAFKKIQIKRQSAFYDTYIDSLIKEAQKLNLKKEDILALIERGYENEKHTN